MKLTLSRTAPGSMPNLSAMVTIRSGRLQVGIVKKETYQNWFGTFDDILGHILFL
jgi:hypothetical protein